VTRAAVFSILVATIAAAQQDTPSPTFRAGTRLVEVDVVARSNGAPATGLTEDDFTLLDNGKPQKIAFFSVQSGRVTAPPSAGAAALPAGVVSNRAEREDRQGNTSVVFLDQRNTPPPEQAFAIQRIAKFIATRGPQDRTGIYTFGRAGSLKVVQEITSDSELLSLAAGNLKFQDPDFRSPDVSGLGGNGGRGLLSARQPGQRPPDISGLQGNAGHTAADEFTALLIRMREIDTKQVLEQTARHLANVPGRKSLIWISTAFPLHWNYLDFTPDMLETARKLNDAGVALYAVDPRGVAGALQGQTSIANAEYGGVHTQEEIQALMIGEGRFPAQFGGDTMGLLSGMTGGLAFANDNGLEKLIQAAADDSEFRYTLGFYPAQEDRDGVRHSLRVGVSKPGIALRYRQNYLASPAASANDRTALQQLLTDAADSLQVALTAAASPDESNTGSWQIKVKVNVRDLQLTHEDAKYAGGIDVSFHVEGAGTVVTKTLKIAIPDDQFAAFLEKGIDTSQTVEATGSEATGSAGAVRVVVQDRTSGAAGSVTVPLSRR
jgi:VWFA-related protein